jgi:hypothetical protein
MKEYTTKKNPSLKKSILYSIIMFNFFIPLYIIIALFSDTKQLITEGAIQRGGLKQTCQSESYDYRGGGYSCDGDVDFYHEPVYTISFGEAVIESLVILKILPLTLLLGIGFGFYYYKDKKHTL